MHLPHSTSRVLSSPQVGFSRAIWRTSSQMFFGSAGRPRLRDLHRQNILNAVRCHLTNVSGFTTYSSWPSWIGIFGYPKSAGNVTSLTCISEKWLKYPIS